jgi:hypothetical protein
MNDYINYWECTDLWEAMMNRTPIRFEYQYEWNNFLAMLTHFVGNDLEAEHILKTLENHYNLYSKKQMPMIFDW